MKGFRRDCTLCLLVIVGIAIAARPTWHLVRRSYVDLCAKKTWEEVSQSSKSTVKEGSPVAWLKIDDAQIDTLVLRGANKDNLSRFPSCQASFSEPGAVGLTVILGHRDSHFKKLDQLSEGDKFKVQVLSGQWMQYSVAKTQVLHKNDVTELIEGGNEQGLLLMTCYPLVYVGEAPQRYLVWAKSTLAMGE